MTNEHRVVKTLCRISDDEYDAHFPEFIAGIDALTDELSEIFSPATTP